MALRQWKEAYNKKKYARQCHEDKPYYIRKKDATWIIVTAKPKVSCIFLLFVVLRPVEKTDLSSKVSSTRCQVALVVQVLLHLCK